jgi:hypothetical protein
MAVLMTYMPFDGYGGLCVVVVVEQLWPLVAKKAADSSSSNSFSRMAGDNRWDTCIY